jgi:Tol biopolymer transport system component
LDPVENKKINLSCEIKWSELEPQYSKNNGQIIFQSARNGSRQIYSIDLSDRSRKKTPTVNNIYYFTVSPVDGAIAFVDREQKSISFKIIQSNNQVKNLNPRNLSLSLETWSPDGKSLLVVSGNDPNEYYRRTKLQALNIDDVSIKDLTKPHLDIGRSSWSKSGIVFETEKEVRFVNFVGEERKLFKGEGPIWSPDGTKILAKGKDGLIVYEFASKKKQIVLID